MRSRAFLVLVPLLLAFAAPAWAEHDGETLDRILPDIRAAHPGRLSDAQPWIDDNGRTHYRIKWMTPEGRILFFDADARTGRFSPSGSDNGEHWRGRGEPAGVENSGPPEDRNRHHDNWNSGSGAWPGTDWRVHNGGGDWRGGRGAGDNGGWHHGHGGHGS